MRHRQLMTREQQIKWDSDNYKKRKEANRGHNFAYLTDELYRYLELKGYSQVETDNYNNTFFSEYIAKNKVAELRGLGNYARILCIPNRLRIRDYAVFYKPK